MIDIEAARKLCAEVEARVNGISDELRGAESFVGWGDPADYTLADLLDDTDSTFILAAIRDVPKLSSLLREALEEIEDLKAELQDTEPCSMCAASPAAGQAWIGEWRYCHGDDASPTCYERAQAIRASKDLERKNP